jgi:hypothetical protein
MTLNEIVFEQRGVDHEDPRRALLTSRCYIRLTKGKT